jgi:tetratricopeptide (TPR) repeat protein
LTKAANKPSCCSIFTSKIVESLLESGQSDRAMAIIGEIRVPMIDAGEHEVISRLQNELAGRMPGRIEPLEWLVDFYGRTSDSFRLPDALAHLGDALAAANQLERAKTIFEQLVDRQPDSDSAKRKLDTILRKMGLVAVEPAEPAQAAPKEDLQAEIPKAPSPKLRPDVESTLAPAAGDKPASVSVPAEPALDEETQKFIAQSLTDVDLFASYGLTQKAIGLLEAILRRAPRHTPTLEKLLDFVLGAGDDRRTAELASQLEQIHIDRADLRGAERFGELRRRFQRAAGLTDAELAASAVPAQPDTPVATIPEIPIMEIAAEPEPVAEEEAHKFEEPRPTEAAPAETVEANAPSRPSEAQEEVDLSDEWASMLEDSHPAEPAVKQPPTHPAPPPAHPEVAAEPVAFEEFSIAEEPFLADPSKAHETSELGLPVESPGATEVESNAFADISAELPAVDEPEAIPAPPKQGHAPAVPEKPVVQEESVAHKEPAPPAATEPEFELDHDYELVLEPESLVPAYDQKPPAIPIVVPEPRPEPAASHAAQSSAAPPASGFASDQFLSDLAKEIDDLGLDALIPSHSEPAPPPAPPRAEEKPASLAEHSPLKEVFDDFRAELGEMGAEDEDLETHYNLGTAFREMGLLDEAISEFQKVAKATERGKPFRYVMQCCTLLGLAFMEKGQPGIAAIWYERALLTPGIEPESILALRYDLGVAQESAGEPEAALKSFSQVYAMNIDYRDVADRIAALQKPIR